MDLKELPRHAFARHPWERVRADFFLGLLRRKIGNEGLSALDIGAGDAYFAGRLLADGPAVARVTCYDTGYGAAWLQEQAAARPGLAFTAKRPGETFGLVLLLDVLEHAADDRALLDEAIASAAQPGGWLLLSAPAHPILFSRHDELLGHKRRYSPAGLRALATQAGLAIAADGQLFTGLLLPRALAKLCEAMPSRKVAAPPAADHIETALGTWHHGPMVTLAARKLLGLDAAVCRLAADRRFPLPGLTAWVLARRQ
ncbi:MAG: methyltransferase domain-containing protein [Deltaproteobacteria bacterium]|nr:methyltransferase domain-containing protein [Deltaproteobacteria bacterium]